MSTYMIELGTMDQIHVVDAALRAWRKNKQWVLDHQSGHVSDEDRAEAEEAVAVIDMVLGQ
jgi:hypothetical protein